MRARSGPAVQAQHAPYEATIRRAPVLKREEEEGGRTARRRPALGRSVTLLLVAVVSPPASA